MRIKKLTFSVGLTSFALLLASCHTSVTSNTSKNNVITSTTSVDTTTESSTTTANDTTTVATTTNPVTTTVEMGNTTTSTTTATTAAEATVSTASENTTTTSETTQTTTEAVEPPLLGDANLDGHISISDAVAILQYIANKDKFPLSAEAADNADVYNRGDGITAGDALSIQKLDAGILTELPES